MPPAAVVDGREQGLSRRTIGWCDYDPQTMPEIPEHPVSEIDDLVRHHHPVRRVVAAVLLAAAVGMVATVVVFAMALGSGESVDAGTRVSVTIPKGATASDVASLLAREGVVRSRLTFLARMRLNGDAIDVRAGRYQLTSGASYDAIMGKLTKGPPPAPTFRIVFPEGFRVVDMARRVDGLRAERASQGLPPLPAFTGAQYRQAVARAALPAGFGKAGSSKEGFLFPATYELRKDATADELVRKQLEAFRRGAGSIDLGYARSRNLTPYEVVTIASMVEREARLDKERPLVAGVIYNRLRKRMTLGIDATIQYAVSGPAGFKTSLTQSDLAIDSPYNTRLRMGLPPTPIANPGLESLRAAADPAEVDYLYYVLKPGGSGAHFFTSSFDEFSAQAARQ